MTRFAVALGSNMGDRLQTLRRAVASLGEFSDVERVSALYETAPVGGPEQDPYLNAVVVIESELSAIDLLEETQRLEHAAGRTRDVRWGPRTLDIDLISTDGENLTRPELTLPHPRSSERRFVLEPLSEVWPEAIVAGGVSAVSALPATRSQEVTPLAAQWLSGDGHVGRLWVAAQLVWFVAIGFGLFLGGDLPESVDIIVVVGVVTLGGGLFLMVWSAAALGKNLTALPEPVSGGAMISAGPYGLVRHPMYTAVVLTFLGASLAVGSLVAATLALALVVFFYMKSRYEERQLRIAYSTYDAYANSVRYRFIPGVL